MKLKEKLASAATTKYWNGVAEHFKEGNGFYYGFLAGFEMAKKMCGECLKDPTVWVFEDSNEEEVNDTEFHYALKRIETIGEEEAK